MDEKILILKSVYRDGKFIGYKLEPPTADCGELLLLDLSTIGYRLTVEYVPIEFGGSNDAGAFLQPAVSNQLH